MAETRTIQQGDPRPPPRQEEDITGDFVHTWPILRVPLEGFSSPRAQSRVLLTDVLHSEMYLVSMLPYMMIPFSTSSAPMCHVTISIKLFLEWGLLYVTYTLEDHPLPFYCSRVAQLRWIVCEPTFLARGRCHLLQHKSVSRSWPMMYSLGLLSGLANDSTESCVY